MLGCSCLVSLRKLTFLLALALVTLALAGTGPSLISPVVVWAKPLNFAQSYYAPPGALSISVGTNGVYAGGGNEVRRYDFDGNVVWTTQISPFATVTGVAVGARGVYVVGAGGDAFVDLYSFNGALIWTRFIEAGGVFTESVSVDSAAVYVAGTVEKFQEWPNHNTGHTFVAKFDLNGNELWSQRIDVDSRLATAISVGPKGVYVAENTHSFLECHDCPYFTNTFLTAIDLDGNTVWTKKINNETLDIECYCSSTVSTGPNGIYVGENTVLRTPLGQFAFVSFVRKYDFGGNEIWTRFVSLDYRQSRIIGISGDSKGAYVAGDGFVEHLGPNGSEIWTLHIGGQVFRTISVSSKGGVFVAGFPSIDRLCASPSCIHN